MRAGLTCVVVKVATGGLQSQTLVKFCVMGVSRNYPIVTEVRDDSLPVNLLGKRYEIPKLLIPQREFFIDHVRDILRSGSTARARGHERVFLTYDGAPAQHRYMQRCLTKPDQGPPPVHVAPRQRQQLRRSLFPSRRPLAQRRQRRAAVDDDERAGVHVGSGSDEAEAAHAADGWEWINAGAEDRGRDGVGVEEEEGTELSDLLAVTAKKYERVPNVPLECPICHKKCAHIGAMTQHAGSYSCYFIEGSRKVVCANCGTICKEPTALTKHSHSQVCKDRCDDLSREPGRRAKYLFDQREVVRILREGIEAQRIQIGLAAMKQLSAFRSGQAAEF